MIVNIRVFPGPVEEKGEPLDVWLRFVEKDDEAEAEANIYRVERVEDTWDGSREIESVVYRVEWYLNSVGLVRAVDFETYAAAQKWLEGEGFNDYSS